MIRITAGKLGSGKTLSEIREMFLDKSGRKTYSNIHTKMKNVVRINAGMLLKKEKVFKKTLKNGENVYDEKTMFNKDFWLEVKKPLSIVLDESHLLFNSRRSMSRVNIELEKFVSMGRRICGQDMSGYGSMAFVTQLPYTIDKVTRDLCNEIRYCISHYKIRCLKCMKAFPESSETPKKFTSCPLCGNWRMKKYGYLIEVFHFESLELFESWQAGGGSLYYDHYFIKEPEKYFKMYDTLQWEDILHDFE